MDVSKFFDELLSEADKTMKICDYAKGLKEYQFNALVSMLFDTYAREHKEYNLLENSAHIISNVYRMIGRNPHDDDIK